MSKRLQDKARLIHLPPVADAGTQGVLNRSTAPADIPRAKTAPGTMLGFMSNQSAAVHEAEQLRERLKSFDGSAPVRALDPALVSPSKWANRHVSNFSGSEFEDLKNEIAQAGGNVQPIKVRPKVGVLNGSTPEQLAGYELVYGHRRHRACLELGLPVLALIEDASDQQLFEQMERENRGRKNLSAWEQGCMYRQALDEGLYPSQRKLAEAVGVDLALVSKSLSLARLPLGVVNAFPSPLEIQYRWAQPLSEVVQKDPDGTLTKAQALARQTPRPTAIQVFNALTGVVLNGSTPEPSATAIQVKKGGRKLATIEGDAQGRVVVRIAAGVLPESKRSALAKVLEQFLAD